MLQILKILHVFTDASSCAFETVAYFRFVYKGIALNLRLLLRSRD